MAWWFLMLFRSRFSLTNYFIVDNEIDLYDFLNYLLFIDMNPALHSNLPFHKQFLVPVHSSKRLNVLKLPNEYSNACFHHTTTQLSISFLYLNQFLLYIFLAVMFILQEMAKFRVIEFSLASKPTWWVVSVLKWVRNELLFGKLLALHFLS